MKPISNKYILMRSLYVGPAALAEKRKDLKFDACTWLSYLEVFIVLRVRDAVFSKDTAGPFDYDVDI